jgi:hypothetical protein
MFVGGTHWEPEGRAMFHIRTFILSFADFS